MTTYTIKEASEISGLPGSTLRYYESMGLIRDIERDSSSKHRVYNTMDLDIINAISCLSATGMSIGDMKKYLESIKQGGPSNKEQIKLLKDQYKKLLEEERMLKIKKQYVNKKIEYWNAINNKASEKDMNKILDEVQDIAKQLKKK